MLASPIFRPRGTGLGSSSTFLVALLHALHSYKGEFVSAEELAREAVKVEREILGEEGGKQDQYIAAYGGTNFMKFRNDGSVEVVNAVSHDSNLKKVEGSLLLLYTKRERSSTEIHRDQIENSSEKMNVYDEMKKLTDGTLKAICDGDLDKLGELVHRNWMMKRSLSSRISDRWIDEKYERAQKLGAKGGKLVGAGGGGFLLLVAEPEKHGNIARELGLRKVDFRFSQSGSRVIFVGE